MVFYDRFGGRFYLVSGIVDENVDAPLAGNNFSHVAGDILPAHDVADETKCITARFDQLGNGLVHAVPFSPSQSNFGPLRAGELRNFEPDPDAPAGNDDDLVLKTHVSASLIWNDGPIK
jgi:hypothetical protein